MINIKPINRNALLVTVFGVLTVFLGGAVGFVNTLPEKGEAVFGVSGTQDQPYIAYNPTNDQYLAVWSDCRNFLNNCTYGGGDRRSVYGQLFDGQGKCLGGNFIIADQPTGKQHPSAVYNSSRNEYLVLWQGHKYDFAGDEAVYYKKGYDIWGQRVSVSGDMLGSEFRISKLPNGNPDIDDDDQQWYPRAAYSPEGDNGGRYMVVWHDGRTRQVFDDLYFKSANDKTTFKDIYGQIVRGDGVLLGDNFPVTIDSANVENQYFGNAKRIQQYADIAYDSSQKRFLVVWEDDRLGVGDPHPLDQHYDLLNMDIFGGFFGINGQPQGDNFLISKTTESERYPRVVFNPAHSEFMVVWQSDVTNYANGTNSYIGVYGQRLSSDGNKISGRLEFNPNTVLHNKYFGEDAPPRQNVIYDPTSSNYLVTWGERFSTGGGFQLYNTEVAVPSGVVGTKVLLEGSVLGYENLFGKSGLDHFKAYLQWPSWAGKQVVMFKLNGGAIDNCPAGGAVPTLPPSVTITSTPTPGGGSATWNEISPAFIGQCHGTNKLGTGLTSGVTVSWGYDAGKPFFWSTIEPERGRYVWDTIDDQLAGVADGQKIWLQVQTSNDGNQVMPSWTVSSDPTYPYPGTCETTGTCVRQLPEHIYPYRPLCVGKEQYKNGRPVQWDRNYLKYFEELIVAMATKYNDNPKVEAILMMSGGNYGEMSQTYGRYCHGDCGTGLAPETPECPSSPETSCIAYVRDKKNIYIQEMVRAHPQETADSLVRPFSDGRYDFVSKFDYYYAENSKRLVDIYAKNFNKPVVLQLGSGISCSAVVATAVADYAVETYGRKVWLKQNGWGNAANGFDPYAYFFTGYRDKTRTIREVGHPGQWCQQSPVNSCARGSLAETTLHNSNAVKAALESGISSVCFQSQFLDSRYFSNYPVDFAHLYQGLVSNYDRFYKSLPIPTGVVPSVSPAVTATPTVTATPKITNTPTSTPTLGAGESLLAFNIKLYGIDDKINDQNIEVKIKGDAIERNYSTRAVFNDDGYGSSSITLGSDIKGDGFRIFIRARNHLWQEYCAFGQIWKCDNYDKGFDLPYKNTIDLSRWVIWPGDVADSFGNKDGVIDATDFFRLKSQLGQKGDDLTADFDFNGVVNGRDVALFLKSIEKNN